MNDVEFYNGFSFRLYEFIHNRSHIFDAMPYHFIAYVYKGIAHFVSQDGDFTVTSGDFFYLPKGLNYRSSWEVDEEVRFATFGFSFFPQPEKRYYPMQKIRAVPEAVRLQAQLVANRRVSSTSVGILYQLLGCLQPHMTYAEQSKKTVLVEQAENYWQEHPFANAQETAQVCGVSASSLYAAFRDVRECSMVEAKHKLLADKAVDLLLTTDKSIEDISEQLGFSSATYFRKVFREQLSLSPRDARKGGSRVIKGRHGG